MLPIPDFVDPKFAKIQIYKRAFGFDCLSVFSAQIETVKESHIEGPEPEASKISGCF